MPEQKQTSQTKICRPEKLTARWVNEMSEAIYNLCPTQSKLFIKHDETTQNIEYMWKKYQQSLSHTIYTTL